MSNQAPPPRPVVRALSSLWRCAAAALAVSQGRLWELVNTELHHAQVTDSVTVSDFSSKNAQQGVQRPEPRGILGNVGSLIQNQKTKLALDKIGH